MNNIRKYLIENDLLECIVQLPNDLFYNTGIATYIWVITKSKLYGEQAKIKLATRFDKEVQDHGLIYVLRNGITDMGIKLKVCYFKPESNLNEKDNALYQKNVVSVTRQFYFSTNTHETIDMVISVNGIPVIALELKNQFTGQNYFDAIEQYKDRDAKEKIFRLNYRFLVYFAVDHYYITTCPQKLWRNSSTKLCSTYTILLKNNF